MLAGLGAATAAGLYYYTKYNLPKVLALENKVKERTASEKEPGSYVDGLPVYSSGDVAKHTDESTGVWVSYKSGVYDITPFIKSHPGTIKLILLVVLVVAKFRCF